MQEADNSLFDLPSAEPHDAGVSAERPISREQISAVRSAFERAGVTSQEKRQQIVISCTIRHVDSLRDLYARDVRPILRRLDAYSQRAGDTTGSAWDNREEDTWIDKL
ncbi:hypothetical protein [Arthrobacter sp. Marseille-P9274]|uniref:hypothetical protein n=1 Tax=Arthrobacter sp. Marseille-P9274 TaxID=2866572 RepID=UPI0021C62D04|nr:hypothetical protein [Arthrobacter sp. Marseille-P9274]